MNGQTEKNQHMFSVNMRKEMNITGVKDVESFDEGSVILQTTGGEMTVEGRNLHIGVLDTERGIVTLNGQIDGVFYEGDHSEEKHGIFGRIFR